MLSLKTLLLIDFLVASISCIPLMFLPENMQTVYGLCHVGTFSKECEMITMLNKLFTGRNLVVVFIIYFAYATTDRKTRRGIALVIMIWCFYMPWVYLQSNFMEQPISKVTVVSLLIFGTLYGIAIWEDFKCDTPRNQ